MKKNLLFSLLSLAPTLGFMQTFSPSTSTLEPVEPEWGYSTKALGDSCGTYFNNYVGLTKTTGLLTEYMRLGDAVNDSRYNGRAQRFTVSQPVEISGMEFYAFHESLTQDSIMVITSLHSYIALTDSVGPEIIRDTVYVTHSAFTAVLPNISVKSYFDTPITMTTDYIIAMHSTEDEALSIITNNYNINEGNGEGHSYALYQNPFYPSFHGWYANLTDFTSTYDYDYLMSPLVKFDLHNSFTILDDTICPDVVSAGCVTYVQMGNFTNHMYNQQSGSSAMHNVWLWGDGFQNTDLLSACHTYANSGTFDINLRDTLFRHDFNSPHCVVNITQPIEVLDLPNPAFSFVQDHLDADFTNLSTNSDSVWWDFGDGSPGTDIENPTHVYTTVGTFTVWLHAYNECFADSTSLLVTTDDVGIASNSNTLSIYPNPANTNFVINGLSGETEITLLNLLGEKISSTRTSNTQELIHVNHLPTGTYFVKITSANGQVTKKIVVKH